MKKQKLYSVLIVDDHPVFRNGLRTLLDGQNNLEVCGEAGSADEALQQLKTLKPSIILADLSLSGRNGVELIKDIRAQLSQIPILVLSMYDDVLHAERALKAGANGYLTKSDAPEHIICAIQRVLAGENYISPALAVLMVSSMCGKRSRSHKADNSEASMQVASLSDKELQILELIGAGCTTGKIANSLNISVNTVQTHRARLKQKLNLLDAASLTQFAVKWVGLS